MKKEKTNLDFVIDIIDELQHHEHGQEQFNEKINEAREFLGEINREFEKKLDDLRDIIKLVKEERDDTQSQLNNIQQMTDYETYFVGLDTLFIQFKDGNLKVQQDVDDFIRRLQRENAVIPA